MNAQKTRDALPFALAAIFLLSMAILVVLYRGARLQPNTFGIEIGKAILQIGVVSVIGTVVSVLVFEYQRRRQQFDRDREHERALDEQENERQRKQLEYREGLLRDTLARSRAVYNAVVKSKGMLIARAIIRKGSYHQHDIALAPYETSMETITEANIELENLKRDVDINGIAFSMPVRLQQALESMSMFLTNLILEYQGSRHKFKGDEPTLHLVQLNELMAFLGPFDGSEFQLHFIIPYREVQSVVQNDLLHPELKAIDKPVVTG